LLLFCRRFIVFAVSAGRYADYAIFAISLITSHCHFLRRRCRRCQRRCLMPLRFAYYSLRFVSAFSCQRRCHATAPAAACRRLSRHYFLAFAMMLPPLIFAFCCAFARFSYLFHAAAVFAFDVD